ncbi:DUF6133 family protein [Ethanoligenens sp.]|uniref:DUF6133 family protein n=1 Tax=Ethanoligenens sp. TaxID=2099655 RepID=UPI0039EBC3D7
MSKIHRLRNSVRHHMTRGYLEALTVRENVKGAAVAVMKNDDGYVDTAMKIVIGVVIGLALLGIFWLIITVTGNAAQTKITNGYNYNG